MLETLGAIGLICFLAALVGLCVILLGALSHRVYPVSAFYTGVVLLVAGGLGLIFLT